MRFLDPDMRNFSGLYVLMFAVLLALVIWGIVGVIVWGP